MTKPLLLFSLCCAIVGKEKLPAGLTAHEWAEVRATHQRHRHAAQADGRGALQAYNASQNWTTRFDGEGFLVQPKSSTWSWGLTLERYGFAGHLRPVTGKGKLSNNLNRIELERGGVQEWWLNDTRGLEHGFTLPRRPQHADAAGLLRLELAVRGSLHPRVTADAQGASFVDQNGAVVVNYGGLKVWDATGRVLKSRMEASAGHLAIVLDEREAQYPLTIDPIAQQAYLKASNTGAGDLFGSTVAISGDTMVVGAYGESSNATGVNGNQGDDGASTAGAAYVFVRSGGTWTQQAYLKASNAQAGDVFGWSVAISGDTIVVGAYSEDSNATGVNGNQADNSADTPGAAYVFIRNGTTWTQQAYLKASNTQNSDLFGYFVGISGDTVVVGAPGEDSNASGVNGNQADDSAGNAGAAYVFVRSGTSWTQQAYLKASNPDADDYFGFRVALSGNTVVVGAYVEDSNATGVNGDQADNSAANSGAAYVFVRSGTTWTQQAYLKASNAGSGDLFGSSVAISGDTVVVGAYYEASNASGVNGNQANNSTGGAGAAYVFVRSGTTWTQQAYLKASNPGLYYSFGYSVAVSGDAVVVGAPSEPSGASGVNGNQADNSANGAGAAYLFERSGATWTQQAYLKASNPQIADSFGRSVAVSGTTVVAGAYGEDSNATGVNGSQSNNSAAGSGAVYAFNDPVPDTVNLTVSPGVVQWTCVAGRAAPSSVLQTDGTGSFSLVPQLPWLALATTTGRAGRPFTLALQSCGLSPGNYSSNLTFMVGAAEAAIVLVQLTVVSPPELFSTPGQLSFLRESGAPEPAAQKLWVVARSMNVGYALSTPSPWLEIVNAGNQTPQQLEVRLKQPPTELGVYQAEVLVTSAEAENSPLRIPVTYTVTPVTPKIGGGVYDLATLSPGAVARGARATVFGSNLADGGNLAQAAPYPLELGGVVVKVNTIPCPIFYTNPGQLAFEIPTSLSAGPAKLVVERNGVASQEVLFTVQ